MIGRVISRGVSRARLLRPGTAPALDWSRSFGSPSGSDSSDTPSRTLQHFGPGKLIGKTALITG